MFDIILYTYPLNGIDENITTHTTLKKQDIVLYHFENVNMIYQRGVSSILI